ncbi:MAG TPA: PAS domain-containing sensor histidine kinase [Candidatus Saccharimonadales bacterium]|nr:PAS domain-containing sensor histidine kinase [Candidatus Saccharimonadales bacterium]
MAVKIHEFFTTYNRKATMIFLALQTVAALFAGCLAWLAWHSMDLSPIASLIVGLLVMVATNGIAAVLLLSYTSEPLRILSQAVAHVSNDPVVTPPPDINIKRYEHSGLKAMVKAIYELAVASPSSPPTTTDQSTNPDFFRFLADGMPSGIIALDANGAIMYANAAAPVNATSHGTQEINLIFEQNDDLAKWLADCQANKVRDDHLWLRVANQMPGAADRRIFDVAGHYQKNAQGGIEVLLVAFDRTAAYAPDQDDMDFIALAAHELRGPITVIRGYLDVFNEEIGQSLTAEQHILLERLQVSAERLSGYINNILNVSRYDRDRFSMHPQEEQLMDILKGLAPDLALRARTQRRKLTFQIPNDLPTIAADRTSLSEVIVNLIDNAIKYSHENGEVTIAAARKENMVEITVTDHGIGMPGAVVNNLFNKFYRSHRSREAVGGTGLGLYICKAIVEGHGGTIWVRSKEGQGTTFGFTLPVYATVAQKLANGDNKDIVQRSEGWIKNHAMYRR